MLLIVLAACTFSSVPPHADAASQILEAGLELDWERSAEHARALAVAVEGLNATDRLRWDATRSAAEDLVRAGKKSEFAKAYGDLMVTCEACHAGQSLHGALAEGHPGAFSALEWSVVTSDRSLADDGLSRLRSAPDLGPSLARFLDLGGKIRDANSPAEAGRFFGKAVLECYQCHGVRPM